MVALAKVPVRMSVEEFLNWDSGDFLTYELVMGNRARWRRHRGHMGCWRMNWVV